MKRPSFQFYPGDWLSDPGVSMLSEAAEGLYIRLLCYAHQSEKRGYLMTPGPIIDQKNVEKFSKSGGKKFEKLFKEILDLGLFLIDKDGYFYNKRMVKDAQLESLRAEYGKKGGNPILVNQNSSRRLTSVDENLPPPSSSSSSSKKNIYILEKISEDWEPHLELAKKMAELYPELQIATEIVRFRAKSLSSGKESQNWDAEFQVWCATTRPHNQKQSVKATETSGVKPKWQILKEAALVESRWEPGMTYNLLDWNYDKTGCHFRKGSLTLNVSDLVIVKGA